MAGHSVRKDTPDKFTLLVASAEPRANAQHEIKIAERHATLTVQYGDFADAMAKAAAALTEAKKYAANEHQVKMLDHYIDS